ncbi:MAG: response regulator [Desulfobacterales bacterium]|nr:response regulator [Desulfobacterales bacterium]
MSHTSKILIIDDEPRMCDSLKILLSNEGYETKTTHSGLEALECFAKNDFDLVLLDIALPDITGHDIMDHINRKNPETFVIVITGQASVDSAIESLRKGAFDYIRKPFEHEKLLIAVKNALNQKRLKNERERVENALQAERQRLFSLLDGIPAYVYLLAPDYSIRFANRCFREQFGDPEGRPCYQALTGRDEPCRLCRPFRVFESKRPETWEWSPNKRQTYQVYDYPFTDVDDSPLVLELGIDITKRKRLEARVRQSQKMEAIGTLASGIAHDFNNLLMGIQGNVSLILMNIDSAHPHYERLKHIENQVVSGAKLTSHLLGYARKGRYEIKPLGLNQLAEETAETFGRTKKKITVSRELAEDLFIIEADQGQIEQVLLGLFVNAADAMPGGGDLVLKTMNATHEDIDGKLYEPKPGNYALLTVADTGAGMDKETMQRVFDPFFTTKEMGRGTGLGLAAVYGIIKGHGGYINVDSEKGRGTTFRIYLPASEKEIPKPVKPAQRLIEGTGTVLLVDDEDIILKVGRSLLEAMGYSVITAWDGEKAVDVYMKNQDNIDIVLLDVVMPNMGGGEAYDRLKGINPNVKVLLSSGFSVDGEATEILERGCNGFIQKPFTMKELSGKIREILEHTAG